MFGASGFNSLFDSYGRQARLYPVLLTIFPPLLTVLAWFPTLLSSSVGATLLTIVTSCGLLYALASISRTKGKEVEERLLGEWGGWPTTHLLRHTSSLDMHTRIRYHRFLADCIPELSFPTAQLEAENQDAADAVYISAVKWLKEKTRGKEFALIEKENAQYGFCRNLRGLKAAGLLSCIFCSVISLCFILLKFEMIEYGLNTGIWQPYFSAVANHGAAIWSATVFNIAAIFIWTRLVNDDWVKGASQQYAEALLAACDKISQSTAEKKSSNDIARATAKRSRTL